MSLYQIKDWDLHFENSKSRERLQCSFVCVPNKQHGMSFSRIMAEPDGAMIYGVWNLILGACSQQRKPRDGWLTSDGYQTGTPWVPQDLSVKFRRPVSEIERSLQVLCSEHIGWIIQHSTRRVPAEYPLGIVKEGKKEENEESPSAPSVASLPPLLIDQIDLKTIKASEVALKADRNGSEAKKSVSKWKNLPIGNAWCRTFLKFQGRDYVWSSRDDKAASELSGSGVDRETIAEVMASTFLNDKSFWFGKIKDLSLFLSQFNTLHSEWIEIKKKNIPSKPTGCFAEDES